MSTARTTALAGCLLAAGSLLAGPALAATPAASRIGADKPLVTWSGRSNMPVGGLICLSSDDPVCDSFFLEATSAGQVVVTLSAPEGDDWDIVVHDGDGTVIASSAKQGTAADIVSFDVVPGGNYEVDAAPFLVTSGQGYQGRATFAAAGG